MESEASAAAKASAIDALEVASTGLDWLDVERLVLFGFWLANELREELKDPSADLDRDDPWSELSARIWGLDDSARAAAMRRALQIDSIIDRIQTDWRYHDGATYVSDDPERDANARTTEVIEELCGLGHFAVEDSTFTRRDLADVMEAAVGRVRAAAPAPHGDSAAGSTLAHLLASLGDSTPGTFTDLACGIGDTLAAAARRGRTELRGSDTDDHALWLAQARLDVWSSQAATVNGDVLASDGADPLEGFLVLDPPVGVPSRMASVSLDHPDEVWIRALQNRLAPLSVGVVVLSADALPLSRQPGTVLNRYLVDGFVRAVLLLPPGLRAVSNAPATVWLMAGDADPSFPVRLVDARLVPRNLFGDVDQEVVEFLARVMWGSDVGEPRPAWLTVSSLVDSGTDSGEAAAALSGTSALVQELRIANFKSESPRV